MEINVNNWKEFRELPLQLKALILLILLAVPLVILLAITLAFLGVLAVPIAIVLALASPIIGLAAWIVKGALKIVFASLPLIVIATAIYLIFFR